MPIDFCTISSKCGWYMSVPCCRTRELVLEGLARLDAALVEAGDAVHAVGQEHAVPVHGLVGSGSRFST